MKKSPGESRGASNVWNLNVK
ncbi:hypothetical protein PACF725_0047 [Pseudomonas aeruginosa]|nr:hypothetical protein PACF725_0047 [Pseudomonas aeruginosa]